MICLDLFCGAGGAAMGIHRSGLFDRIIGFDIVEQPDYPFEFVKGDALSADIASLAPDFIWASPPCQRFVTLVDVDPSAKTDREDYHDWITPTREMLAGHPWTCIENVADAPIRPDIVLEGGNVGIPNMKRKRKFEVSWETGMHAKPFTDGYVLHKIYGRGGTRDPKTRERRLARGLPKTITVAEVQELWDMDWTDDWGRITEMVPPAYSTYIVRDAQSHGLGGAL